MTNLGDPLTSLSAHLKAEGLLAPELSGVSNSHVTVAEATTIIAVRHTGGKAVTLAADRRASAGHRIVKDDMMKLFLADSHSAIGIAGTAGLGIEFARLFALELEHVEKIEGHALSHEGKVRRLSILVRAHLQLALQGLAAVPLLAGFDERLGLVRVHTFCLLYTSPSPRDSANYLVCRLLDVEPVDICLLYTSDAADDSTEV